MRAPGFLRALGLRVPPPLCPSPLQVPKEEEEVTRSALLGNTWGLLSL